MYHDSVLYTQRYQYVHHTTKPKASIQANRGMASNSVHFTC